MGFQASAGRILITDSTDANHVVFDTDEHLLVFTDFAVGAVNIPQRQSTSNLSNMNFVDVSVDYVVGSINPAANVVFGAFQTSWLDQYQDPSGWFQATGSLMHMRVPINSSGNTSGGVATPPWQSIGGHQILTFRASGGQLILNERTYLRTTLAQGHTVVSSTIPASTVTFRLFCGTFV